MPRSRLTYCGVALTLRLGRGPLLPRVVSVRYPDGYRLLLRFSDGQAGGIDFAPRLRGRSDVFAPLQDIGFFKRVGVDEEAGTLVWPNGVNFCLVVLYETAVGELAPTG